MNVRKFLANLRARGVRVWCEGDDLFVDPDTALTLSDVAKIHKHKSEILACLRSENTPPMMPELFAATAGGRQLSIRS